MEKGIIVFATNNQHKLAEVRQILGGKFDVRSLREIGCEADLPETHDTLQGNALEKAQYVKEHFGYDCFADDTGLEVDALGGKPGIYSARYASIAEDGWPGCEGDHDSEANMRKLLFMLSGKADRKARFRTVIALVMGSETHFFEGIVEGEITATRHGAEGFGYDPIFRPEGRPETFAEMPAEAKNAISHRGRAVAKLADFLVR